jgi:hypothetical protein
MNKNQAVIEIEVRNVYGNTTIYPVNEQAKLLALIAGTKTLTNTVLAYAERMGFTIQEATPAKTRFATKSMGGQSCAISS